MKKRYAVFAPGTEVSFDGRYSVISTGPLYEKIGGAVSVYDLEKQKLLYTIPHVLKNHQISAVKVQ